MALADQLREDMKTALRAGEKLRVTTLRMALADLKTRQIDLGRAPDDAESQAALAKMIKQRRDAAAQYTDAGRDELAEKERKEIEILEAYLPEPLDESELDALIAAAIEASGASTPRDMGKVMAKLKQDVQGRADMGAVSARVKARLTG